MTAKHPSSSNASCLGQLGCLGVLLLGWAFLATLPNSLYFVLTIAVLLVSFLIWKKRKTVVSLFREGDHSPTLGAIRQKSLILVIAVAAIVTYVCFSLVGSPSFLFSCLFSMVLWIVVLHLGAIEYSRNRSKKGLPYILLTNLREFALTVGFVLAVYTPFSIRMRTLPLDDMTVSRLMDWETRVTQVHVFLDVLKFSFLQLLGLVVAFFILRTCERYFAGSTSTSERTWSWVLAGMRWVERFSLVFLIAASITFLGTKADGPVARISAQIRDDKEQYNELQRIIAKNTEHSVRLKVLSDAWNHRPEAVAAAMKRSQSLIESRRDLENLAAEASNKYQIKIAMPETTPLMPKPDDNEQQEDNLQTIFAQRGDLNARQIATLLEVAKDPDFGNPDKEEPEAPQDELLKKTFEKLLPAEHLTDHVSSLATLSGSYPVFGEFLSTIASAFADAGFQHLKRLAIRKILATHLSPTKSSMQSTIDRSAAEVASAVQFDWSQFSEAWKNRTELKIANRISSIAAVRARLIAEASRDRDRQVATLSAEVSAKRRELLKLSAGLEDTSLSEKADKIDGALRELDALSRSWPALGDVPSTQNQSLEEIVPRMSHIFTVDNPLMGITSPSHAFHYFASSDPVAALHLLSSYSNDLIVTTVGKSATSPESKRSAQRALGPAYYSYLGQWNAQVEARRAEIARQKEAKRQAAIEEYHREQEQQREQEERHEEVDHPEIP